MVALKAVPATCAPGLATAMDATGPEATMKGELVPATVPAVAVSVVVCASTSVIEADATPAANDTDDTPVAQVPRPGYVGAVWLGEFDGPVKVTHFVPV